MSKLEEYIKDLEESKDDSIAYIKHLEEFIIDVSDKYVKDLEDDINDLEEYLDEIENRFIHNKNYFDYYDYFVANHIYTCVINGRPVRKGFYFCYKCAKRFGLLKKNGKLKKPSEWPDWIRFLYNNERMWRGIGRKHHTIVPYDEEFNEDDEPN